MRTTNNTVTTLSTILLTLLGFYVNLFRAYSNSYLACFTVTFPTPSFHYSEVLYAPAHDWLLRFKTCDNRTSAITNEFKNCNDLASKIIDNTMKSLRWTPYNKNGHFHILLQFILDASKRTEVLDSLFSKVYSNIVRSFQIGSYCGHLLPLHRYILF